MPSTPQLDPDPSRIVELCRHGVTLKLREQHRRRNLTAELYRRLFKGLRPGLLAALPSCQFAPHPSSHVRYSDHLSEYRTMSIARLTSAHFALRISMRTGV